MEIKFGKIYEKVPSGKVPSDWFPYKYLVPISKDLSGSPRWARYKCLVLERDDITYEITKAEFKREYKEIGS